MNLPMPEPPPNQQPQGATPLYIAAHKGRKDVAQLLLDRGADVDAKHKDVSVAAC